jgi:nucleotide-binding universal stress UspA family protein
VIVATIGLSMGILNQNLFTLIVTMAVVTTTAMPPMLRWALKRLPLRKKERVRLEREELDAKGFVTNLERLLLAADDSANGKFAAQLAGAIAGSGGKPTTVVNMNTDNRGNRAARPRAEKADRDAANADAEESKTTVENAAEGTTTLEAHADEEKRGNADVTTRRNKSGGHEALAGEARKGYDLLVVGIAKTRDPKGGFSKNISLAAKGFEGPVVVVDAHESHSDRLSDRYGKILLPVNGTDVSRRAAEIALTLARASGAQVTALYVTRANGNGGKRKSATRKRVTRRNEQAVLEDIGALGDRYQVSVRSATRVNMAPEEAILKEAKRGYDLIVLGVSRRPGDTLFFGNTAASVLDHSDISNLFVAS